VGSPVALSAGSNAVDCTGTDLLLTSVAGLNSGFTAALSQPSVLEYDGVSYVTPIFTSTGTGGSITEFYRVFALRAPASGSNTLSITFQSGTYGAGPVGVALRLSGVEQSGTYFDIGGEDTTAGTSFSVTPASMPAGALAVFFGADGFDAAHTQSGTNTELGETTANNATIALGTGTSASAGGWSAGTNLVGVVITFLQAAAPGGVVAGPLVDAIRLKSKVGGGLVSRAPLIVPAFARKTIVPVTRKLWLPERIAA
jgi:hypothetical protein